jgi:hypothetical protein
MNRWVSTRRTLRSIEIPRDTGPAVLTYRRWLGAIFIAGGVFAIYGLATQYNERAAIALLGLDIFRPSFASWVVESARWVLIVGNVAGTIVGVALVFFPGALVDLEARGARWALGARVCQERRR